MSRTRADDPFEILLIEDNPGDVRLVREAVAESTVVCSVSVYTDGEAALRELSRRSRPDVDAPDLTLLDLNLPKVDGNALLEAIGVETIDRIGPIVVFSGSQAAEDVERTKAFGVHAYVVKPADPFEYISTIRSIVESVALDGSVCLENGAGRNQHR